MSKRHTNSLEWISLYEDPLVAVLPKDSPVPENNIFPIQNFHEEHFIISAQGTDYDVHHALDFSHIEPNMQFSATDDHTIVSMVANDLGVSILPQLTLQNLEVQVSYYLLEPYYSRELGIAVKSKAAMSPAALKFLEVTRQILPELTSQKVSSTL